MVLTGYEMQRQLKKKNIIIDPYDENHMNPNSYDLTLSNEIVVYKKRPVSPSQGIVRDLGNPSEDVNTLQVLNYRDIKSVQDYTRFVMPTGGIVLVPGILYLMKTVEMTWSDKYVPIIEGRSSIARHGIFVHITAGFGDIGFRGNWTLEVTVVEPVKIYPGIRICQVYWMLPKGSIKQKYEGKYQDSYTTMGSRLDEDFKK